MRFQCVQGSFFRFFARLSFRSILHFHLSFVVDCSKKCLAGVAGWRSVLLRPCLANLFLRWWLPSKSFFFARRLQQISRIPAVQVKET